MWVSTALLAACLAALATADPSIDSALVPAKVANDFAIFLAATSASTSTSYTLEHTRITIVKHGASSSAASHGLLGHRRPRIVVTDAAAKGVVCLPKGTLAAKVDDAVVVEAGELTKADLTVGQGKGITATVDSGAAAAASAGSGAAAAASSGSGAAAAASSGSGAASAASSGDSTATSTSGDASAEAASGSSSSSSSSSEGGVSVDASGENAQAAALSADGISVTVSGDGSYSVVDESNCECVPAYLCDQDGFINTFGSGIIDIRTFADKPARAYASKCKADEACCRHRHGEDRQPIGWLPGGCGTRSPIRLDRRIVGGEASRIGKNPWIVALLKKTGDHDEYLCGGSLIAEDVVLTGAHCVKGYQADSLIARVGEWDTSSKDQVYPTENIDVSQVVAHEGFNAKTLFNDVALLKLKKPATISPHVNVICLPTAEHPQIDFNDCVATGWGKDSFENGVYASILKEVPLSTVDSDSCQASLRKTRLGRWFQLHDSFTCAGGKAGIDTCKGDGGSPLVCRGAPGLDDEEKFVQVGIVAWGIGCGKAGVPGVYADVTKLLPWIQQKLPQLSQLTESYAP